MKWVIFKSLLIAYKALNGTGKSYIREMLPPAKVYRKGFRLSDDPLRLEESRTKLITYGDRALSIATVKSWNDLPLDISLAKTMDTFISKLKTHFFQIVYGWSYYPCCIIALMNISSNRTMDLALTKSNLLLLFIITWWETLCGFPPSAFDVMFNDFLMLVHYTSQIILL